MQASTNTCSTDKMYLSALSFFALHQTQARDATKLFGSLTLLSAPA